MTVFVFLAALVFIQGAMSGKYDNMTKDEKLTLMIKGPWDCLNAEDCDFWCQGVQDKLMGCYASLKTGDKSCAHCQDVVHLPSSKRNEKKASTFPFGIGSIISTIGNSLGFLAGTKTG